MSTEEPTLKSEEDADLESYENVEDDAIPMGNSIEKSLSSSFSSKGFLGEILKLHVAILALLLLGLYTIGKVIYTMVLDSKGKDEMEEDKCDGDDTDQNSFEGGTNNIISTSLLENYLVGGGVFHFVMKIDKNTSLWNPDHHYWKYFMVVTEEDGFDPANQYLCWTEVQNQYPGLWIHPYRNDFLLVMSDPEENSDENKKWLIEDFPIGRYFYLAIVLSYQKLDIFIDGALRISTSFNGNPPTTLNNLKGFIRDKPGEQIASTFKFTRGDISVKTIQDVAQSTMRRN